MPEISCDWLVFHRVRFSRAIDGTDKPLPGPELADAWRFYPSSPRGASGVRTNISDEWGGFGLYSKRSDAEAVFNAPDEYLPFLPDTVEAFHALAVPFAHRGAVKWRGHVQDGTAITPCDADPGGPLMVLTSAGFENPGPEDMPRIRTFLEGVDRVVAYYGTLPGNIRRGVYGGVGVDGQDGMTASLWASDAVMLEAAYQSGDHRDEMDYHRSQSHFDRSSFTRARIIDRKGTWNGSDPVSEMA